VIIQHTESNGWKNTGKIEKEGGGHGFMNSAVAYDPILIV